MCKQRFVRDGLLSLAFCLILKFIITLEVELMKTLFVLAHYQKLQAVNSLKMPSRRISAERIKRVGVTGPFNSIATLLRPAARHDNGSESISNYV